MHIKFFLKFPIGDIIFMNIKSICKKGKDVIKMSYYFRYLKRKRLNENLILIESKNGEDIAGNMFRILEEIRNGAYESYKVCVPYSHNKEEEIKSRIGRKKDKNIIFVEYNSFSYFKYLATAKYLFTDSTFTRSFIKKEGQILTNTWHGTPLKKMGYELDDSAYAMGNIQRNFLQADYLVYPNIYMEEKMVEAYHLDGLYQGTILEEGYPRNTIFFDKEKGKNIREELKLDHKKIYVYMPTWRGYFAQKDIESFLEITERNLEYLEDNLSEDQILYVKFHTYVDQSLDFTKYKKVRPIPKKYEVYEFLNQADELITDYSSVFYDFANASKKITLFAYDEEEYLKIRGIYTPLEEFPFPIVKTVEDLVQAINRKSTYHDEEFKRKYCTFDNEDSTKRLCEHVIKGKKVCREKKIMDIRKKNVLIYGGSFAKNGITTSLLNLLNELDLSKRNYYITFEEGVLKKDPMAIRVIPEGIKILPISGTARLTVTEVIAYLLYFKKNRKGRLIEKKLDRLYKREIQRHFGNITIDCVVHFTGYEKKMTNLFQRFPTPKCIYVHNDMVAEMVAKRNQHRLTLEKSYRTYDKVAAVTEAIVPPIKEIGGKNVNIVEVNNCHNFKAVIERAEEKIIFSKDTKSNYSSLQIEEILELNCNKFINIGRFSKEKGQHMLLEAFSIYLKEHPEDYLFIIGGYGEEYETIVTHAKEISDHIVIIKYMENPMPILKRCDLFILSSFYEGLALTLHEAASLKIPIVCTDIPGPKRFLQEYGGTLVEPTKQGLISGMEAYINGKVTPMEIDYQTYNKRAIQQFEKLIEM